MQGEGVGWGQISVCVCGVGITKMVKGNKGVGQWGCGGMGRWSKWGMVVTNRGWGKGNRHGVGGGEGKAKVGVGRGKGNKGAGGGKGNQLKGGKGKWGMGKGEGKGKGTRPQIKWGRTSKYGVCIKCPKSGKWCVR